MTDVWKKIAAWVTVSFLFCFLCVGYAQVTDILNVVGTAEVTPPASVFITNVSTAGGVAIHGYSGTVVTSTADLSSGSQTIEVTVFNNTGEVYGYNLMKYVEGEYTFDNPNIQVTTSMQKKHEAWKIEPGGYLTFPVTFSYADGASTANPVLNSVIEFEFLPFDEIPDNQEETTVINAMDRFEAILNDPVEHGKLQEYMNDTSIDRWSTSYISNVPGANNTDKAAVEGLFAGNLHIMLDGQQTDVKIMIKRENENNSYSGDEMVIYMTTDPLDTRGKNAVVYRCIYANNNGTWIRISDVQAGTAPVVSYFGISGTGSFNTDKWKAS